MKDCDDGTALCGLKIEIEKWQGNFEWQGNWVDWLEARFGCPHFDTVKFNGIGIVGLHFKCCPLPMDSKPGT